MLRLGQFEDLEDIFKLRVHLIDILHAFAVEFDHVLHAAKPEPLIMLAFALKQGRGAEVSAEG